MSGRTYTQVARAEATERTRHAIVDAVIALFLDEGLFDPPLDRVAERAGTTVRTILRHFGTKDELVAASVREGSERISAQRTTVPGDVGEAVRRLVDHYEEWGDATLRLLAEAERKPAAREVTETGSALHLDWTEEVFAPFLTGLRPGARRTRLAVLASVTDLQTWALLRRRHGLDRDAAEAAIRDLVDHAAKGATP